MDIGDNIMEELTAEEEHDCDLAEDSFWRHVPIAHSGAGHHQEPDGVQVVKAPWLKYSYRESFHWTKNIWKTQPGSAQFSLEYSNQGSPEFSDQ